jgi:hypothetical protein
MTTNGSGQVAFVYYQPIPNHLEISGKQYNFDVHRGISLCWIDEEDTERVLGITMVCCGNSPKNVYRFATEGQVRVWSGWAER